MVPQDKDRRVALGDAAPSEPGSTGLAQAHAGSNGAANGSIAAPAPASARGIVSAWRQLFAFCGSQRVWLACMVVFVLTWTVELYLVQAITLVYPNETSSSPRFAFWAPKIRFTLDLLFIAGLSCWLRRRWLVAAVVGAFFAYLGLLTYFHYFQRPLSLMTILNNWREGTKLVKFSLDLVPKRAAAALAAALAVQIAALWMSRKASLPRASAWLGGSVLGACYVSLYLAANQLDPLHWIQTTRGVGRLGEIRGYLGPWFAEWYYLGDDRILNRAIEMREVRYDRLTPVEADIPVNKHLVILQAESLDYNILGHTVDGVEVTPFLNRLRDASMFYRVGAMHFNGSADADFAALNAVSGSRHVNTYSLPGYPYADTTPEMLADCGFLVYSFHGNSGEFYSRRGAFEKMGFTGLYFQEELEGRYGLKADSWGVRDKDLLAFSAQKLRTAGVPTCHFVITLTTHVPYNMLAQDEKVIYPHPRTIVENYVNNMRYLDTCLATYLRSLGSGTTVMIYADHPTEEGDASFAPDVAGGRQFIPCFIYDSDQDLSKLQKTRGKAIASDGSLNLVDVVNYLRHQVARVYPPDAAGKQVPKDNALEHAR